MKNEQNNSACGLFQECPVSALDKEFCNACRAKMETGDDKRHDLACMLAAMTRRIARTERKIGQ